MKQRIFMYLFVFAVLLIIFQYANAKRIFGDQNKRLTSANAKIERLTDSIKTLEDKVLYSSHFKFENNEDAISYFERDGYSAKDVMSTVKDAIYSTNETKGQHPIVPYASSEGRKILINTVKLLNHKWIIADFSDGEFWGEVFLTYRILENGKIEFNLVESFLYPFD
jgi:hypothetical protein